MFPRCISGAFFLWNFVEMSRLGQCTVYRRPVQLSLFLIEFSSVGQKPEIGCVVTKKTMELGGGPDPFTRTPGQSSLLTLQG